MTRATVIGAALLLVLSVLPSVVAAFIAPDAPTYQLGSGLRAAGSTSDTTALERVPAHTTTTAAARVAMSKRSSAAGAINGHPCGGDLPPCWVLDRETGGTGDPNSYNPDGCVERDEHGNVQHQGCSGKWQCSHSTCSGTGTEDEQDAEARALWADGDGCQHWAACG